jgi:DME family drug/metabolite transporter
MGLIGVTMAFYQVSYFTAVKSLGAAVAALITLCTAPVMVGLLSTALTGEKPTAKILAAMACALAGTGLLIQVRPAGASLAVSLSGVGWALGSALGYSCMVVISRELAGRYHPVQPFAIGLGFGALLLLIFSLFAAGETGLVQGYSPAGWVLLVYLALVPTALAFGLFLAGMRHTPATVASIVTLLEPLTSTILAWLIFGEQLGPLGVVGAALLCGAMLLIWSGAALS